MGEFLTPTKALDVKVKRIEMGDTYGIAEGVLGEIYSWGSNVAGQLGYGDYESRGGVIGRVIEVGGEVGAMGCGGDAVAVVVGGKGREVGERDGKEGKRKTGVEVLLSEQRYLQTSYDLEKGLVRSLESINAELRGQNSELNEKLVRICEDYTTLQKQYSNLKNELDYERKNK